MCPEQSAITHLVQRRDAYTVGIRLHVFCYDVHCDLCEVEIRPDARGCRNACLVQYLADEPHGEVMCRNLSCVEIACHVDEHLINGVYVDVRRGNMPQIDTIDARTVVHVECHARWGNVIGDAELGMRCEFCCIHCFACERPLWGAVSAACVCLLDGADDLE